MQLPDGTYLFGRVIGAELELPQAPMPGAYLIYVYSERSLRKETPDSLVLTPGRLLLPPVFVNRMPWTKGYFENISGGDLADDDVLSQHCFRRWNGDYLDATGQKLLGPLEPCGDWGVIFICGSLIVQLRVRSPCLPRRGCSGRGRPAIGRCSTKQPGASATQVCSPKKDTDLLFVSAHDYTGEYAWDALDLVTFEQPATVRLHWTNTPYVWHINDGERVFVVLDGEVDMHYRDAGVERTQTMRHLPGRGRRRARCPSARGGVGRRHHLGAHTLRRSTSPHSHTTITQEHGNG